MTKNIIIVLLCLIIVLVSFVFFVRANINYQQIKQMKGEQLQSELKYLDNLSKLTAGYNQLQSEYDVLYQNLLEVKEVVSDVEDWQTFEITAYSQESGTITKIGIDLIANYSSYLNIAAVDPQVIPLGSILLVKFSDGSVKPYIAADTGGLIKGKIIDLYMTDVEEALEFGRQNLQIKIIK